MLSFNLVHAWDIWARFSSNIEFRWISLPISENYGCCRKNTISHDVISLKPKVSKRRGCLENEIFPLPLLENEAILTFNTILKLWPNLALWMKIELVCNLIGCFYMSVVFISCLDLRNGSSNWGPETGADLGFFLRRSKFSWVNTMQWKRIFTSFQPQDW